MKTALVAATAFLSLMFVHQAPKQISEGNANRGAYLAEHALMCVQCHSPRTQKGDLIASQKFMGAPIPVAPPSWATNWAIAAPRIAGLPGYTEGTALRLLVKGIARDEAPPQPPMPPFRLSDQDAHDVCAFLFSAR